MTFTQREIGVDSFLLGHST